MSWQDRISEAAYTSPSGTRHIFTYEDVSKNFDKRTTAFEFPGVDGSYIQDSGRSGRRYPMRVIFWGDDYDTQADAFEDALAERGTGILEHPMYGRVDVVPFGNIRRDDPLKSASNQAIITVLFFETTGVVYPTAQNDAAGDVLDSIRDFNAAGSELFGSEIDLDSAVESTTFMDELAAIQATTVAALESVAAVQADVLARFNAVNNSINSGIDTLIDQPIALAFQTFELIQLPARAAANIAARLEGYGNLLDALINNAGVIAPGGNDSRVKNRFKTLDLYASGYITGSVSSVVNNTFEKKTDALEAADTVLTQFDNYRAWRDDNFQSLSEVDTGEDYQALQNAVALAAGFLVEISFSLLQERTIVTSRPRSIVDLCGELYGTVDSKLDFFINSNALTGSEILEIPRGREIVYYV